MNTSSRYWKIWRINPATEKLGYKQIPVTAAQEFANSSVLSIEDSNEQNILLSCFNGEKHGTDAINRAKAGLCLRCYISEPILIQCKKLDSLFSGDKQFSYRDLLPFVLDDDGEKLIILDEDGKTQLVVDDDSKTKVSTYNLFSVKVLQTFNSELQSGMSLDNWAYLQTKQNPDIKRFLSDLGFQHLSDWALLNRARKKQVERLFVQERYIVEAFHAVYRRDRQQQRNRGSKKCPDPTTAQLQEMLVYLQKQQISINTPLQLIAELKHIAQQLRQYDVWGSSESLEIYDGESGRYVTRSDLSSLSVDGADVEEQEFIQFLYEHLHTTLSQIIKQEVEANIQKLLSSKKYQSFAHKYIQGLSLYYELAMSLKEIIPELEMSSWNQARRILNPGELLSKVRFKTVEEMLEGILKKAAEKGLTKIPPEPSYLMNLVEQIESYVDREVFQQAAEEIRTGKDRNMNSVYATELRRYIQESLNS